MGRNSQVLERRVTRIPGACLVVFFLTATIGFAKVWTTVDGRTSEGELVSIEGDQVTLLIGKREYTFPMSRFSSSDRVYLQNWKAEHRCGICRKKVGADKMQAGESFYHSSCFTCLVCDRPFLNRQSIRRDEWGGLVHTEHFKRARSCGSCGRLFSDKNAKTKQFYSDGRVSCLSCLRDAVTDLSTLKAVTKRVRKGMSELGLPSPEGPLTMHLVNQNQLNKELQKAHGRGSLRGLTMTTFRTVSGGPNAGTTYSHQIWVLAGLPVVECVSVLAHEFGHVWMNENLIDASPPAVEGFCNLLSMYLLKKETSKHAEILRKNLEMSDDHVYGRGFREMRKQLSKLGWAGLIRDLSTRRVPLQKRR